MGRIKAIRSEADYKSALDRIDALMDAEPGTPEGEELDVLADLVEHYEEKHVPMTNELQRAIAESLLESLAVGMNGGTEAQLRAMVKGQAMLVITLSIFLPPQYKKITDSSRATAEAALEYLEHN